MKSKPRSRWYYWLDQLRAAGKNGVLGPESVVRDPDRCTKVLIDMGYDIEYRVRNSVSKYTLVGEPKPFESKKVVTFPGEVPEVDDNQEKLF